MHILVEGILILFPTLSGVLLSNTNLQGIRMLISILMSISFARGFSAWCHQWIAQIQGILLKVNQVVNKLHV